MRDVEVRRGVSSGLSLVSPGVDSARLRLFPTSWTLSSLAVVSKMTLFEIDGLSSNPLPSWAAVFTRADRGKDIPGDHTPLVPMGLGRRGKGLEAELIGPVCGGVEKKYQCLLTHQLVYQGPVDLSAARVYKLTCPKKGLGNIRTSLDHSPELLYVYYSTCQLKTD